MIPTQIFFTKGMGVHKNQLQSFEMALRDAHIEQYNLVSVSSIFPPGCRRIEREDGLRMLKPGEVIFCVLSKNSCYEAGRVLAAAVGCAIPTEKGYYGYLSEHHSFGETEKEAAEYAEDMAATMLATTLGIEFDPERDYDERREIYKMSGKIIETESIAQVATGVKGGAWTTVLASAILLP